MPGDDLLPIEDMAVRNHVSACVSCRKELGSYVRARKALRSLTPVVSSSTASFFAELQDETMAAVRRDRESRRPAGLWRGALSRLSFAGGMTAAALILIGVYLMPESRPVYRPLPTLEAAPTRLVEPHGLRFQGVGYGLMGHEIRLLGPVPLEPELEPPASSELAPEPAPAGISSAK